MLKRFDILQKNDYRSKLRLLLWSLLPLFLICYLLAFKKTFNTISSYNKNVLLAQQSSLRQDSASVYDAKLSAINSWKTQYMLDSAVMDANIIAKVNLSCDELGLNFQEYKPLGSSSQGIWTRMMTVEGDFKSMLRLIYQLEQVDKICRIASIHFQKQKAQGDEEGLLNCSLYIQNVLKK